MKIIKDPVHGYIEASSDLVPLIDAAPVQRLRHVRQLGFSYLVYPGANHSRFEHSLGTMHLAGQICRKAGIGKDETTMVVAAALLHDIGHGPFSHASEGLMNDLLGRDHMEISSHLSEPGLLPLLERLPCSPDEISRLVEGSHPNSGILHGELDADRMDYLLRDAHYTGAPYGTFDAGRLIRSLVPGEGGLLLDENGIQAAEALLIARTLMRPAVYFHHVSRIAEQMFMLAHYRYLSVRPDDTRAAFLWDDSRCMQRLMEGPDPVATDLMSRLYERRLYKRALYIGRNEVNTASLRDRIPYDENRRLARAIAETAGVEEYEVLVDIPPFPHDITLGVRVRNRHAVVNLAEVSPLVTILNETRRGQWRLGVYCPGEHRKQVALAAREVLHVYPHTTQEQLPLSEDEPG